MTNVTDDLPGVGEEITITSGPFQNFKGQIVSVDASRRQVLVSVSIFGRAAEVSVPFADLLRDIPLPPEVLSPHLAALEEGDEAERKAAADALRKLGPRARPALPVLLARLETDRRAPVREAAADAIGFIDPAPMEAELCRAISDRSGRVAAAAIRALAKLKEAASTQTRLQIEAALRRRQALVHEAIAGALGAFRQPGSAPTLIRLLEDGASLNARYRAALSLTRIGDFPDDPVSGLIALAQALRADPRRPDIAHYALGRLGGEEALVEMLEDDDPIERCHAAEALCSSGQPDRLPAILGALSRCEEDWQRKAILRALPRLEQADTALLAEALTPMLSQPALRQSAADALQYLGADEELVALIGHDDELVESAAAHALSQMWRPVVIPGLLRALRSDSDRVRRSGIRGLRRHRKEPGVRAALEALRGRETVALNLKALEESLGP